MARRSPPDPHGLAGPGGPGSRIAPVAPLVVFGPSILGPNIAEAVGRVEGSRDVVPPIAIDDGPSPANIDRLGQIGSVPDQRLVRTGIRAEAAFDTGQLPTRRRGSASTDAMTDGWVRRS